MRFTIFLLMLMTFMGCSEPVGSLTQNLQDIRQFKLIVRKRIPLGSSTERARQFFYQEGFTCSEEKNFLGGEYKGYDFVFCDRKDGGPVTFDRWMVALIHDRDFKIKDIQVDVKTVGPIK